MSQHPNLTCPAPPLHQRGIVLIMSLIMLVVISLLATLTMRNATSSESTSGNVRTVVLASQAAEIALRFCETTVVQIKAGGGTPTGFNIQASASPPLWRSTGNWDTVTTAVFQVPLTAVNEVGTFPTFKRRPECMVERVQVVASSGLVSNTSTYVITSRGFGPEVVLEDANRSRPTGSEIWMQSTIELD